MISPSFDADFSQLFSDYPLIRQRCKRVHLINTVDAGINPYRSASHVAVLGVK